MSRQYFSKASTNGRITLPKQVRDALSVAPGDLVEYEVLGNVARIRRASRSNRTTPLDFADAFSEWLSPEDEQAFRDL